MHDYPVFLDLTEARCLIVGGGSVASRKLDGLLRAGVREVFVVAPVVAPSLPEAAQVIRYEREFRPDDVAGCLLVFAASGSRSVNNEVAAACRDRGILCCVADMPEEGRFIVPAVAAHGSLRLAVSTGGNSPALAARIREDLGRELAAWAGERYDRHLALLAGLRPLVLEAQLDQQQRSTILRRLACPELGEALRTRDIAACSVLLERILPKPLQAPAMEMVHALD